jgi:ZIP family zinc transporter
MIEWFASLNPVFQAFLATCFTYGVTALGAASVFLFVKVNRKLLNTMLGFAAGVMIAASYWSLLEPALDLARELDLLPAIPAAVGFLAGGIFLKLIDKTIPHLHFGLALSQAEGPKTKWQRTILLVLAVTIHNIPEGLAVGVAFGALSAQIPSASLAGAVSLALGIGIQNFPEGVAVAVPLRGEGLSRGKSFFIGQISGLVEVLAGLIGVLLTLSMRRMLPYTLAFAAGAMIYVVIEELIPEAQQETSSDLATLGALVGFVSMMILDVTLG